MIAATYGYSVQKKLLCNFCNIAIAVACYPHRNHDKTHIICQWIRVAQPCVFKFICKQFSNIKAVEIVILIRITVFFVGVCSQYCGSV